MDCRTYNSCAWSNWNVRAMNRCDIANFICFRAEKMFLNKLFISIMNGGGRILVLGWGKNLSKN
jgi:hypothetical protein